MLKYSGTCSIVRCIATTIVGISKVRSWKQQSENYHVKSLFTCKDCSSWKGCLLIVFGCCVYSKELYLDGDAWTSFHFIHLYFCCYKWTWKEKCSCDSFFWAWVTRAFIHEKHLEAWTLASIQATYILGLVQNLGFWFQVIRVSQVSIRSNPDTTESMIPMCGEHEGTKHLFCGESELYTARSEALSRGPIDAGALGEECLVRNASYDDTYRK